MNSAAGVVYSSLKVEWATDEAVYRALDQEFHFDYDPCPLEGTEDGLSTLFAPWHGKRCWINPPYGKHIGRWLTRAHEADVAVFLLPARTDTAWFHFCLQHASEIRFVRRRLKFGGQQNSAPFPSVIVIFQKN